MAAGEPKCEAYTKRGKGPRCPYSPQVGSDFCGLHGGKSLPAPDGTLYPAPTISQIVNGFLVLGPSLDEEECADFLASADSPARAQVVLDAIKNDSLDGGGDLLDLLDDGLSRYLVAMRSTLGGGLSLSTHDSLEAAAARCDGEEYPDEWALEFVIDLDSRSVYAAAGTRRTLLTLDNERTESFARRGEVEPAS